MNNPARTHFERIVELPRDQWPALLAAIANADLRRDVQALLDAHVKAAGRNFMSSPTGPDVSAAATTNIAPIAERPGTRIGPYKLLEEIGEGGFGVVFMAEQTAPIRRRVALKVIKLGMDTRAVIARFEAERQALALMDHPNIAKVLDAGSTDTGRPYFVMELVRGEPITHYCDKNSLSIKERLDLFMQVCHAVQHAHGRGVIHRDIKPGNILVATQDGKPFAKVIDFGIAKATDHRLTERTLFTELKSLIGTPEYMSPEQAEGLLDIDTRTDVYALGVLLYELLTGSTPFDPVALRSAGYAGIQRMIREVEPPKPSTRISQSVGTIASVASLRRSEPRKLGPIVRGELDWIVMKALEKDRNRRYETASALSDDVRRHLEGDAVLASPPSPVYRLRKAIRRNRGAFATLGVLGLALTIGLGATAYGMLRAQGAQRVEAQERAAAVKAREQAEADRVAADTARKAAEDEAAKSKALVEFFENALASVDPSGGTRLIQSVPDLPHGMAAISAVQEASLNEFLLRASASAGNSFRGQPLLEARARRSLGQTMYGLGMGDDAVKELARAVELYTKVAGPRDPETLKARLLLGKATWFAPSTSWPDAQPIIQSAYTDAQGVLDPKSYEFICLKSRAACLSRLMQKLSDREAAEAVMQASQVADEAFGSTSNQALEQFSMLAGLFNQFARYDSGFSAEEIADNSTLIRERLRLAHRDRGGADFQTLWLQAIFTLRLCDKKRYEEAAALAEESASGLLHMLGPANAESQFAAYAAVSAEIGRGRPEAGLKSLEPFIQAALASGAGRIHRLSDIAERVGVCLAALKDDTAHREALDHFAELSEAAAPSQDPDHRLELITSLLLGEATFEQTHWAIIRPRAEENLRAAQAVRAGPRALRRAELALGLTEMATGDSRQGLDRCVGAIRQLNSLQSGAFDPLLLGFFKLARYVRGSEWTEQDYRAIEEMTAPAQWETRDGYPLRADWKSYLAMWLSISGGDAARVLPWAEEGWNAFAPTTPGQIRKTPWNTRQYSIVLQAAGHAAEAEAPLRETMVQSTPPSRDAFDSDDFAARLQLAAILIETGRVKEGLPMLDQWLTDLTGTSGKVDQEDKRFVLDLSTMVANRLRIAGHDDLASRITDALDAWKATTVPSGTPK